MLLKFSRQDQIEQSWLNNFNTGEPSEFSTGQPSFLPHCSNLVFQCQLYPSTYQQSSKDFYFTRTLPLISPVVYLLWITLVIFPTLMRPSGLAQIIHLMKLIWLVFNFIASWKMPSLISTFTMAWVRSTVGGTHLAHHRLLYPPRSFVIRLSSFWITRTKYLKIGILWRNWGFWWQISDHKAGNRKDNTTC